MISKKFTQTNTMLANEICLRKLKISDLRMLHDNCSSDEEVAKYCCWNYSKNILETKKVLRKWIKKYESNYNFIWGIECLSDHQLIGTIAVVDKDIKKGVCEVGYSIGKKWWSKGYTTECLKYVLNYLLYFVGFEEVICKAQSRNIASIKVMKKTGMTYIGREEHFIDKTTKEEDYIAIYSIKKTSFVAFNANYFDYKKINFSEFEKFYRNQYKKYNPKIKRINRTLVNLVNSDDLCEKSIKNYCDLLHTRKEILFNVLNEIMTFFKDIKDDKITIYLNGSYARNSQRIFSDIDLNFMYPNKKIKKNLAVEDITAFILTNMFDIKYRDRIHPMGYLTLINNFNLNNSKYYLVVFDSADMVINTCRDNCYDIMYENLNMPRSARNITNYISRENDINYVKEYVYNHEIVYTNIPDYIFETIKKSDATIIKNKAFNYYLHLIIDKTIDDIFFQKEQLCSDIVYVKDFKRKFKTLPSEKLYNVFSILRRIEMYAKKDTNINLIKIDFEKFKVIHASKQFIEKIKFDYYHYIFELNKIEYIFNISNVNLSSHTKQKMNIIRENYKKRFNKNLDEEIFKVLNVLYDDMLYSLNLIREEN